MINVVVDVGNTTAKVGIFNKHELLEEHRLLREKELKTFIQKIQASAILISSVSKNEDSLLQAAAHINQKFILTHKLPLPITNTYATPETLGADRLAGVCGAKQLFPSESCLVIDSGTCITYDFIDAEGKYLGGAIAPGLQMRLKAMHEFTSRLPLAEVKEQIPLIGNSTFTYLQSGALNGMQSEIEGMIVRYQQRSPELKVILCGGDTHFFENNLKGAIFAVRNLVLSGLNSILIHNVNK
jgi:type III pantothenate kinase